MLNNYKRTIARSLSMVVIIFSVNNCHGWHGYVKMLTPPSLEQNKSECNENSTSHTFGYFLVILFFLDASVVIFHNVHPLEYTLADQLNYQLHSNFIQHHTLLVKVI
jgi:hypothetical protein